MKTVTVVLKKKTQSGTDGFGQPIYTTKDVQVKDVLVGEPSTTDIQNALTMYGVRVSYTLAVPKGDSNDWRDAEVVLPAPWSATYHVVGDPTEGIEENIPLRWNKKVHLERMDG